MDPGSDKRDLFSDQKAPRLSNEEKATSADISKPPLEYKRCRSVADYEIGDEVIIRHHDGWKEGVVVERYDIGKKKTAVVDTGLSLFTVVNRMAIARKKEKR